MKVLPHPAGLHAGGKKPLARGAAVGTMTGLIGAGEIGGVGLRRLVRAGALSDGSRALLAP